MNKIFAFFASTCALLSSFVIPSQASADGWDAQFRVAGFAPSSSLARKIYSDVWPQFQLEFSNEVCYPVSLWTNVGWTPKSGKSTYKHNKTNLTLVPIGLGLDVSFDLAQCLEGYIGGGATYTYLHIKDEDHFIKSNRSKWAFGGIVKSGLRYHFHECFFAELFVDYTWVEFKFKERHHVPQHKVNLNGLLFGAGVGVSF